MRKVANAHVKGGGADPHQEIPAQAHHRPDGWVEMRVMTVLNTISYDPAGDATFGELGDPGVLADVGKAWIKMLTLQLGVLIEPLPEGFRLRARPPGSPRGAVRIDQDAEL